MFPSLLLTEEKRELLTYDKTYKIIINEINKNNFNSSKYVGSINALLKNSKAKNKEDWESYYLNYYFKNNKTKLFEDITNEILKKNNDIEILKIFNVIYYLVIDCSWIGHQRELNSSNEMLEFLQECDPSYSLKETNKRWDSVYGVDRALFYDEYLIGGIQLKSESYLKLFTENYHDLSSSNNKVKIKDKKTKDDLFSLSEKLEIFENKFKVPTYIVTYHLSDEISKVLCITKEKRNRYIETTSLF